MSLKCNRITIPRDIYFSAITRTCVLSSERHPGISFIPCLAETSASKTANAIRSRDILRFFRNPTDYCINTVGMTQPIAWSFEAACQSWTDITNLEDWCSTSWTKAAYIVWVTMDLGLCNVFYLYPRLRNQFRHWLQLTHSAFSVD